MKVSKLLFIYVLFFSMATKAQEVNSSAYQVLLKGLLSHSVEELSVQQASEKKNAVFVDAREKKEFEVSHIKNAIHVGYDTLDFSGLDSVNKSNEIIVYCSVGYRSEKVAEQLKKKGFTKVYNLYGGIFEWKNQDQAVYSPNQTETEKIHAYNKVWGIWLNKGVKVYN